MMKTLNPVQKSVFDDVVKSVEKFEEPNRFFFIDRPGGNGKTYVYNTLMSYLRG